jgi:hypothetical protein
VGAAESDVDHSRRPHSSTLLSVMENADNEANAVKYYRLPSLVDQEPYIHL